MANGDVTYSNPGSGDGNNAYASGKYTGIGSSAAINVICGFQPSRIAIYNDTDDCWFVWFKGIAAGSMLQSINDGTQSLVTGGPVVFAGKIGSFDGTNPVAPAAEGFTIPAASSALNTAGDDCYWEAWR